MEDCIFCKIVRGQAPSWNVMESEYAYAFLWKTFPQCREEFDEMLNKLKG